MIVIIIIIIIIIIVNPNDNRHRLNMEKNQSNAIKKSLSKNKKTRQLKLTIDGINTSFTSRNSFSILSHCLFLFFSFFFFL